METPDGDSQTGFGAVGSRVCRNGAADGIGPIAEKLDVRNAIRPRERVLTWFGVALTLLATGMVTIGFVRFAFASFGDRSWVALAAMAAIAVLVSGLIYGGLVYLFARLAFLRRLRMHARAHPDERADLLDDTAPSVTVLVPSYKEEPEVVALTLWSAALQDYPGRRVVLLVDDPPHPTDPLDVARLQAMRQLPADIEGEFGPPLRRLQHEHVRLLERLGAPGWRPRPEFRRLARLYLVAAGWTRRRIERTPVTDGASGTFVDAILRTRLSDLERLATSTALACSETDAEVGVARSLLLRGYRHLIGLFDVELTSFERKRYGNVSHEPNKAMNLNVYLGVMGRRFVEVAAPDGRLLLEESPDGDQLAPWSDYVITLDADSILLDRYARRLVTVMERPGNERVAVAQTPYSAFPGAPGALERMAGATTDIQYIVHQGFAGHDATYWVGANALLRRAALEDIAVQTVEGGAVVTRYVQDHTVIEDTESSIDLVARGWRLHNEPERLAFSATPPDFGSLAVQRARWANGGLLILPKLLRYLAWRTAGRPGFAEGFMRLHYLVSIAVVNTALLVLLAFPVPDDLVSPWLPLTALPYFAAYARDLRLLGYRTTDVLRVYALNVLLIPVNLSGVWGSFRQAISRSKSAFVRTPKVRGRTTAPAWLVAAAFGLVVHWVAAAAFDVAAGRLTHAAFAGAHGLVLGYALVAFVGLRPALDDLREPLRRRGNARGGGARGGRPAPTRAAQVVDATTSEGTANAPQPTSWVSRRSRE